MKEINKNKIENEILKINNKYKYSWEIEGNKILLEENKLYLNEQDKKILGILLIQEVPKELRKKLWLISSGALQLLKENDNNYKNLLKFYEKMENKNHYFYKYLTTKISKDLDRSNLKKEEVYKLKNILSAFTARNLSINYCQGLNLIASYILQVTGYNEEEAFYLYLKLMEDIIPFEYYFFAIGIEAEIELIKNLFEKYDNELYNHIKELNGFCFIDSKFSMWIMSLMLYKIDIKITNLFFDCLFFFCINNNNFIIVLNTMLFSFLTVLRTDLLKCQSSQDLNDVIEKFANEPISDENFKKIVYYNLMSTNKNIFRNKSILEMRKKKIQNIIKTRKMNYQFDENNEEILCDISFPLCVKEKQEKEIEDFIIYKSENELNNYLIEDYYGDKKDELKEINIQENKELTDKINIENENNSEEKNYNNGQDKINDNDICMKNLIIERRKHFCK